MNFSRRCQACQGEITDVELGEEVVRIDPQTMHPLRFHSQCWPDWSREYWPSWSPVPIKGYPQPPNSRELLRKMMAEHGIKAGFTDPPSDRMLSRAMIQRCPLTNEDLIALATPVRDLSNLAHVQVDMLSPDYFDAEDCTLPHLFNFCAGYRSILEFSAHKIESAPGINMIHRHVEVLLAFRTQAAVYTGFAKMRSSFAPNKHASDGLHMGDCPIVVPRLGNKCLAWSENPISRSSNRVGDQQGGDGTVGLNILFYRGPVVVFTTDTFTVEHVDFDTAIALAREIDVRIAATLE